MILVIGGANQGNIVRHRKVSGLPLDFWGGL